MHANAAYAVRALQSGALGYVLKDFRLLRYSLRDRVCVAIKALSGLRDCGRCARNAFENGIRRRRFPDLSSPREREILQLVAEGNTSASIADRLTLSIRTVELPVNTMKKLRLTSNAELVKFAINTGLITP